MYSCGGLRIAIEAMCGFVWLSRAMYSSEGLCIAMEGYL